MGTKSARYLMTITGALFCITLILTDGIPCVVGALGEYLHPTTVLSLDLPAGCTLIRDLPAPGLLRVMERQKQMYNLSLQKVAVCRSSQSMPELEAGSAAETLSWATHRRWRPLERGCCSCQYHRHVIVEFAGPGDDGSTVLQAALIQNRWDYFRLRMSEVRGSWVFRWCWSGAEIMASAVKRIVTRH